MFNARASFTLNFPLTFLNTDVEIQCSEIEFGFVEMASHCSPPQNPIIVPSIICAYIGAYTKVNCANELDKSHVWIGNNTTANYLSIGIVYPRYPVSEVMDSKKNSIPTLLRIDSISW